MTWYNENNSSNWRSAYMYLMTLQVQDKPSTNVNNKILKFKYLFNKNDQAQFITPDPDRHQMKLILMTCL